MNVRRPAGVTDCVHGAIPRDGGVDKTRGARGVEHDVETAVTADEVDRAACERARGVACESFDEARGESAVDAGAFVRKKTR